MFDVTPKTVTMKDVAKEAGCHPSTVSLALRGDARIPEATRKKVSLAAAQLGYQTNPLVSAWVSARRAGRVAERCLPLAYLERRDVANADASESVFRAAREKAKAYGYSLSKFYIDDYAKNIARLNQVLQTRSVQGVLLSPNLEGCDLEGMDWNQFAIVAIGYGISSPKAHRVVEDHGSTMKQAFDACVLNGSRRIGLALSMESNEMRQGHWLGAYLREQAKALSLEERLPIHFGSDGHQGSGARSWLARNEPEVLLVDDVAAWEGCGIRCIDLTRLGQIQTPLREESCGDVGRAAVDLLSNLVTSNVRGIPHQRRTVLVESSLCDVECSFVAEEELEALSA